MNLVSVPVDVLMRWRMEDRDIHRLLVMRGRLTTREIQDAMRFSRSATRQALARLECLGVAASACVAGRGRGTMYWRQAYAPSRATLTRGGRVTPKTSKICKRFWWVAA